MPGQSVSKGLQSLLSTGKAPTHANPVQILRPTAIKVVSTFIQVISTRIDLSAKPFSDFKKLHTQACRRAAWIFEVLV